MINVARGDLSAPVLTGAGLPYQGRVYIFLCGAIMRELNIVFSDLQVLERYLKLIEEDTREAHQKYSPLDSI